MTITLNSDRGTYYRQCREFEQHHHHGEVNSHRTQSHVGVESQRGLILLHYLFRALGRYLALLRLCKK